MNFHEFSVELTATMRRDNPPEIRRSMVLRKMRTDLPMKMRAKYAYNDYLQYCWPGALRTLKVGIRSESGGEAKRVRVASADSPTNVSSPTERPSVSSDTLVAAYAVGFGYGMNEQVDWCLAAETAESFDAALSRDSPTWQIETAEKDDDDVESLVEGPEGLFDPESEI